MPNEPTRLSGTSYAVLGLIAAWGPCTPYDLKKAIESTVENFWPVPHTTFYVEPARLEEAGLLSVDQEEHGRRRKLYAITRAGRQALAEWVQEPTAAPPQLRDEMVLKVFLGADPAPLAEERVAWHREKLTELNGYLEAMRAAEPTPASEGIVRSLQIGTVYTRTMMQLVERLRGPA